MKKKIFFYSGLGLVVVAAVGLFVLIQIIEKSVNDITAYAQGRYEGDQVTALMALVDDPSAELKQRDRATWCLGQLRDPRALPMLETYNDGQKCDHKTLLCRKEVVKAINLIQDANPVVTADSSN